MKSTTKPTSRRKAAPTFNPLSTQEAKEVKAKRTAKKSGGANTENAKGKGDAGKGSKTPAAEIEVKPLVAEKIVDILPMLRSAARRAEIAG